MLQSAIFFIITTWNDAFTHAHIYHQRHKYLCVYTDNTLAHTRRLSWFSCFLSTASFIQQRKWPRCVCVCVCVCKTKYVSNTVKGLCQARVYGSSIRGVTGRGRAMVVEFVNGFKTTVISVWLHVLNVWGNFNYLSVRSSERSEIYIC